MKTQSFCMCNQYTPKRQTGFRPHTWFSLQVLSLNCLVTVNLFWWNVCESFSFFRLFLSELLGDWRHCLSTGCPRRVATIDTHQLQSCVLELCRFFSQCLCSTSAHKTHTKRFVSPEHLLEVELCVLWSSVRLHPQDSLVEFSTVNELFSERQYLEKAI